MKHCLLSWNSSCSYRCFSVTPDEICRWWLYRCLFVGQPPALCWCYSISQAGVGVRWSPRAKLLASAEPSCITQPLLGSRVVNSDALAFPAGSWARFAQRMLRPVVHSCPALRCPVQPAGSWAHLNLPELLVGCMAFISEHIRPEGPIRSPALNLSISQAIKFHPRPPGYSSLPVLKFLCTAPVPCFITEVGAFQWNVFSMELVMLVKWVRSLQNE